MSQFQVFESSMGPGGGPVLSLTGDDAVVVVPNGITGNINVEAKPSNVPALYAFAQFVGAATPENPAVFPANTLKLQPLSDTLTTVGNVETFFPNAFYTLSPSQAVVLTANIIGHRDDYSAACGGYACGVARKPAVGASVFVGDDPLISDDTNAMAEASIALTGDTLGVVVNGVAGQTWNWTCTYTFQVSLI